MLTPKKTIPSLAVAMLALSGAGCADDGGLPGAGGSGATAGTGGTSGTAGVPGGNLGNALQSFCMKVAQCFSDYSVQDCLDYYASVLPGEPDANCEAALVTYFSCGLSLECDELGLYENSCDDEFLTAVEICNPEG